MRPPSARRPRPPSFGENGTRTGKSCRHAPAADPGIRAAKPLNQRQDKIHYLK